MKKILIRSFSIILLGGLLVFPVLKYVRPNPLNDPEAGVRFDENAGDAKSFLISHPEYNQDFVFLVDMAVKSRYHRFFVYNVKSDIIEEKGLVAHGIGSETGTYGELEFGNTESSNKTSLGNYRIGNSYTGRFGKSYKLHGLDATNSNAFSRYIVLHTFAFMPHEEQLVPVMRSEGCPMVSTDFFKILEKRIDASPKPVLMRIYYK